MGKKKAGGSKGSATAAVEDDDGPLWVERRRLEEDWGRSAGKVEQGLEGWRGTLRTLLSLVQEAPPPPTSAPLSSIDNNDVGIAAAIPRGPGVNVPPGQAWALRVEATAEAVREERARVLAVLERIDARCRAFREQLRLATTAMGDASTSQPTHADGVGKKEEEESRLAVASPPPLSLAAAFEASASGTTGLIPTLATVEAGLRGAWDAFGTLEHLATSIDKAALAGAAANERLAVLSLLLQQYTWRAVERTGEEGP